MLTRTASHGRHSNKSRSTCIGQRAEEQDTVRRVDRVAYDTPVPVSHVALRRRLESEGGLAPEGHQPLEVHLEPRGAVRQRARLELARRSWRSVVDLDGKARGVEALELADPRRENRCVGRSAKITPKPLHLGRSGTRRVFRAKVPLEENPVRLLIEESLSRTPRRREGFINCSLTAMPYARSRNPLVNARSAFTALDLARNGCPKGAPAVVQVRAVRNRKQLGALSSKGP
jgi:hypothetical protein